MLRPISYDFLVAETEAWPIGSDAAFTAATVALDRDEEGVPTADTAHLANALETWLRTRSGGLSLEVLREIRDQAWFDRLPAGDRPCRRQLPLTRHLLHLAHRYLESRGNQLCLKEQEGIGVAQRAERWRWLSFRLPQDLLLAAIAASERREPLGEQVSLLTPVLARLLDERNVAETHLHVGASVPFPLLWTATMATLGTTPPKPAMLERGGNPPFGSGAECLRRLFEAAISRLLLSSFLAALTFPLGPSFERFCDAEEGGLANIAQAMGWRRGAKDAHGELLRVLARFGWSTGETDRQVMQSLYVSLLGSGSYLRLEAADVAERDPLAAWLLPGPGRALPETQLAARGLRYLLDFEDRDPMFERIFWQYQRTRCLIFRHVVEEPGTGGLDWFSSHYQRFLELRRSLDREIYRRALESESVDLRLSALEARTQPPATWQEVCQEVRSLAEQAIAFGESNESAGRHDKAHPEVALLFHFIKHTGVDRPTSGSAGDAGRGRRPGRRGSYRPRRCRHGAWYYEQLQRACAVEGALERCPEILLLLRGLDIANAELAIPTWVTLPLFHRVRQASNRAAELLARRRPGWQVPRLRVTCHLGEDFVRLAQGLRRIHEPIEFGLLETGSRIGHAVALGVDPEVWAKSMTTVPQSVEERLCDLLWELDRYGGSDLPAETGRHEFVRHEAVRLARWLYDDSPDLDNLLEARRRLHSVPQLEAIHFPVVRRPAWRVENDRAFELLWRCLTDPAVFDRGQQKVEVRVTPSEVAFLHAAQQWLRKTLGRMEITVESNPSSNLLVGGFDALENHPAFRLLPLPSQRDPLEAPVMLSVNTDDPITFASHLSDEFAHIYFALTRRGVASDEALAWLDQARQHGWLSRFSLPASRSTENLRVLCDLLGPVRQARA